MLSWWIHASSYIVILDWPCAWRRWFTWVVNFIQLILMYIVLCLSHNHSVFINWLWIKVSGCLVVDSDVNSGDWKYMTCLCSTRMLINAFYKGGFLLIIISQLILLLVIESIALITRKLLGLIEFHAHREIMSMSLHVNCVLLFNVRDIFGRLDLSALWWIWGVVSVAGDKFDFIS